MLVTSLLVLSLAAAPASTPVAGRMFVAVQQGGGGVIAQFDANGKRLADLAASPSEVYGGIAFAADGRLIATHGTKFDSIDGDGNVVPHEVLLPVAAPAIGPRGNVYLPVQDDLAGEVIVSDPNGGFVTNFDGGSQGGVLDDAIGLAFGPEGRLYVLEFGTESLAVFSNDGDFLRRIDGNGAFDAPTSVCVDETGDVLILSNTQNLIRRFTDSTSGIAIVSSLTPNPPTNITRGLAIGPNGHVFAGTANSVIEMDRDGTVLRTIPVGGAVQSIAFAPYRFKARCTGALQPVEADAVKIGESAVVSIAPGGGTVLIDFADGGAIGPGIESDALAFATAFAPLEGRGASRIAIGRQLLGRGTNVTFASIGLEFDGAATGKLKGFAPDAIVGSIAVSSSAGVLRATLKSNKILND